MDVAEKGFPGFSIVGLPDKAVGEARERVKTALVNSGFAFPQKKIIVNLAPADLPKEGSAYDLAMAVGILVANGDINVDGRDESRPYGEGNKIEALFYGELSLDGSLRHTKGTLLVALFAKKEHKKRIFLPVLSANEAAVVSDIEVLPVRNLKELILHLMGEKKIEPLKKIEINSF